VIVNQWVPAAHKGDAVGDSARRMRTLLRAMGHESDIYALNDERRAMRRSRSRRQTRRRDHLHYAPSPMTEAFAAKGAGQHANDAGVGFGPTARSFSLTTLARWS
jgi:hypothetical protein